jgi:dTDP-4-dehydrorhamnose reductase
LVYKLRNRPDIKCLATSVGANRTKAKEGYVYEALDITDEQALYDIFDKYKPDAVINTAAMTNVDACEVKKEECHRLNFDAVSYLVKACEKHRSHFIQISTDFVFDGDKGQPYSEEDKPNPQSYYAQSKYDAELLIQESKIKWAILRTIIIYGVVDDRQRSNLVLWTKNALEQKQNIKVITDQYRAPTLAEDLADACIETALRGATGIYHVSGAETKSIYDLVVSVADFFNLDKSGINPVTSAELNQSARRPPYTGFVIDKARRDLNYNPHSFSEGLEIVKQQLQNEP